MTDETTSTVPERWAAKFFTVWTGQAFSLVGSALVQFALVNIEQNNQQTVESAG